ncbi:MAG: aminotransferase class III-fold pyridoxal phosphate-dependent enzyme, partial [Eubacterium sp.]
LLNQELLVKPQDIPNFVMFNALQNFIDTSDFTKKTQALGTRMIGKLRALEANSGKKFTIKGKGLTLFINFKTEKLCDGFITFMRTKGILVKKFDARPEFVLIYPPLILTEKNIDEIVENFKKFFNQPA